MALSKTQGTLMAAVIAALGAITAAYVGGIKKGTDDTTSKSGRAFQVQVFSQANKAGIQGARVDLGGSNLGSETTDNVGTAVFTLKEDKLGAQGSLTVTAAGFKRFVDNNVLLQPTRAAHTVYLDVDQQAAATPTPTPTSPRQPERMVVTYSTGPKMSGSRKDFSDWYPACSGAPPGPGFRIVDDSLVLAGDRHCNAWSECQLVSRTPAQVCYRFRLQGHDEWPPPGQAASEGIVSVTWEKTQ